MCYNNNNLLKGFRFRLIKFATIILALFSLCYLSIGGHGTLQKYSGTGTRYFAKISTAVPVLSN